MPTFDFMTLLWWGLPFAAAPVIIHLINLLRHRVVRWPAMEFLLASQRRYRTRILLKQLLLLLLRILAIAGLVLLFAQPRWDRKLGSVLGGNRTRHVVLLDDSYSMGEVFGVSDSAAPPTTTAMSRGRKMAERLLEELAATPGQQEFSLGRLSQLQRTSSGHSNDTAETTSDEQLFDIYAQAITPQNLDSVRTDIQKIRTSATTTEITPGIRTITPIFAGDDGSGVLWLITDLRSNDWLASEDIADALKPLADAGIEIHIVDTATTESDTEFLQNLPRSNLTVERIEMIGGTPVSNVLLPWEVTVRKLLAITLTTSVSYYPRGPA